MPTRGANPLLPPMTDVVMAMRENRHRKRRRHNIESALKALLSRLRIEARSPGDSLVMA